MPYKTFVEKYEDGELDFFEALEKFQKIEGYLRKWRPIYHDLKKVIVKDTEEYGELFGNCYKQFTGNLEIICSGNFLKIKENRSGRRWK